MNDLQKSQTFLRQVLAGAIARNGGQLVIERFPEVQGLNPTIVTFSNPLDGTLVVQNHGEQELPQYNWGVDFNDLALRVNTSNHKWWHDDKGNRIERNKGELIALIHSELSEALEGERKNLQDNHLPNRRMAEVELADAIIRILDYAGAYGYDLQGAFEEKMAYNATRKDHTHEDRAKANGKKF